VEALLSRRRLAEEKFLGTQRGSSLRGSLLHCDDSAVTNLPNATVSDAVTGRAITSFVMTRGRPRFRLAQVRGAGRLCVAPEGESNQEILGIAVRQARQVMSG